MIDRFWLRVLGLIGIVVILFEVGIILLRAWGEADWRLFG